MFVLQLVGWFIFSCMLMSFIEHQVHCRLMHTRTDAFLKAYKAHALDHHQHYLKIFSDEPVPPGEDKEIQLTVRKAPVKAIPFALVISLISWQGALVFVFVATMHHWLWNKVHLEMHKPEQKVFSNWAPYKFLARYHWLHHRYQDKNFNVVFPFADYLLGTSARPNAEDLIRMEEQLSGKQPVLVASQVKEKVLH
jgi:Fatty acid hydroxylase superfamily